MQDLKTRKPILRFDKDLEILEVVTLVTSYVYTSEVYHIESKKEDPDYGVEISLKDLDRKKIYDWRFYIKKKYLYFTVYETAYAHLLAYISSLNNIDRRFGKLRQFTCQEVAEMIQYGNILTLYRADYENHCVDQIQYVHFPFRGPYLELKKVTFSVSNSLEYNFTGFTFRSEELNKGYEYGEDINLLHSLHQNSQEAVKCIDRWNKFRLDRYT
ncbi:MAG: hypothetical protein AAF378_18155, partial [Cyanobacteria bacterium P01_A01_bin.84]